MKYLSLFSGIGGFELGIQQAYENYKNNETARKNSGAGLDTLRYERDKPSTTSRNGNGRRVCPICIGYSELPTVVLLSWV